MFCRYCGAEIKAGAQFCENCGARVDIKQPAAEQGVAQRPKKLWQKAWFTWVMVVLFWPIGLFLLWKNEVGSKLVRIIVTAIFAAAMVAALSDVKSPPPNAPSGKTAARGEETPLYICNLPGVGRVKGGRSSDVGIAIYKITETGIIGTSSPPRRAEGRYIILNVSVYNGQKDAIVVDNAFFKLVDDQGREFSYTAEDARALTRKGDYKGFLSKVNPGSDLNLEIPFDVPTDASGLKLKAKGGFTGKDIILPLKVDLVH